MSIYINPNSIEDNSIQPSKLSTDTTHRFVTDAEKDAWNGKQDTLVSGTNIKTINGESVLGEGNIVVSGGGTSLVEITYSELKTLRDNNNLKPGCLYRITDYITTTVQADTTSAGHQFDIIVLATSESTLSEEAKAIQHSGDTYFANSKLESWEIKYCLDNDNSMYYWADSNGKGVIWYMKDEWDNECPYDFKNIMFQRPLTDGEYDPDGNDTWVYTFNWTDANGNTSDLSVEQFVHPNDEGGYNNTYGNIIREYRYDDDINYGPLQLNDIVFLSSEFYDGGFYYGCYSNTFGTNCSENTFGVVCYDNTFGTNCGHNTFGNNCGYNTFGDRCSNNTFGTNCSENTFGTNCSENTFGNNCGYNTFGTYCNYNTFGDRCDHNTFGNTCQYNTFASNSGGTAGNYFRYNTLESNVQYCIIYNTSTASFSQLVKNYHIKSSVVGTSSSKKLIEATRNLAYDTTVAINSSGELKIYCEADLIQ